MMRDIDIASKWKALSGENNWKDLLEPNIDKDLRYYINHYGKMVGAVVDALNDVKRSRSYKLCRCPEETLFSMVCLTKGNPIKYQVTKYIYFFSKVSIGGWILHGKSAWIGYVAVSTDEGSLKLGRRDILVCWRGTNTKTEWSNNFQVLPTSAAKLFGGTHNDPKVHHGFYDCYNAKDPNSSHNKRSSARDQVLAEVRKLVDKYSLEEVSITVAGHSLGGALATLNAMDIVFNGYNKPTGSTSTGGFLVTAFVYGSPHVGDEGFQNVFNGLSDLHLLRIEDAFDIVPTLLRKCFPCYKHVGNVLTINCSMSEYLKPSCSAHDLNTCLHVIAGYQGSDPYSKLVIDHDIALVNKYTDGLKGSDIPSKWWKVKDRIGMVQMDNGSWKLYVPGPPSDDDTEDEIIPPKKKRKTSQET